MKRLQLVFACVSVAMLCAVSAMATPIPGYYSSTDIGGDLLVGRSSTSWPSVHGNFGVGNVFNVHSWDGSALGTQWTAMCGIEPSAYTVTDHRVGGNGTVDYSSTFLGGSIWFGPGPWGSGVGTLNTTYVVTTVTYMMIGGVSTAVNARANMQSSGTFTENNCTLNFILANGTGVGQTDGPPGYNVKPATYPDFRDPSCSPTRVYGSWGDVSEIELVIQCVTPTKAPTWGVIRRMYR
jgi:hypothetical protein